MPSSSTTALAGTSETKKVVLITGGTSGLGRISAQKILCDGHTVVITGRSKSRLDEAVAWIKPSAKEKERLHTLILDLESLENIRSFVESFKALGLTLDVVVNNAGIIPSSHEFVKETMVVEKTFWTNIVAPWYLTMLLKPLLPRGGRILFVTSALHDPNFKVPSAALGVDYVTTPNFFDNLDGNQRFLGLGFYKASKLAMMWIAYLLAKQNPELVVIPFEPGFIPTTSLSRESPWLVRQILRYILPWFNHALTSEETAAHWYLQYATSPDFSAASGQYFFSGKKLDSSERSHNMEEATKFWNISCDICETPGYRLP
ncbi:hypothetical protein BDB00DRAFT_814031 [Zychaea mexicana]|uniref:uncharacterized protein n=1 Tax=Zychaea mexicana TaxID=64656 RepID=UPI0022FDE568|nr:uncharacterized protein BDB00DRAFT_814031 [Zychaea mexicana]KAI9495294.1 hypothetical protein BDB00DRAFT_814031 [Zychaea mexicana]